MKILFVAMANSIHVARWLRQLDGPGWDLHLFPSVPGAPLHPELPPVTVHGGSPVLSSAESAAPDARARELAALIDALQPDLVHSIEFQHGGYLALAARALTEKPFPKWMATNWGNDIYLFGRLAAHRARIKALLAACDYYSCEGERDVRLARTYGFTGQSWPVMPNTGGLDLARAAQLRQPPAARRTIVVKGYQGLMGRALVALEAIRRTADALGGYTIGVYSAATEDVQVACELLRADTGLDVRIVGERPHHEMQALFGSARVYMGLSISDGASTSMLEAIGLGALPIQSSTASADEWIEHGRNGFIVPPEDPAAVADALRRAVTDDALVEQAAAINAQIAAKRLDARAIRERVITLYRQMRAGQALSMDDLPAAGIPRAATNGKAAVSPLVPSPYDLDHVRTARVFGAGPHRAAARELCARCGWTLQGWIDNDRRTWGTVVDGLDVQSPHDLSDAPSDLVIIASDAHHDAIARQLEAAGRRYGRDVIGYRSAVRIGSTRIQVE